MTATEVKPAVTEVKPVGTIDYRTAFQRLTPVAREDALDVMARLADLTARQSTDQAPGQWREPALDYSDPDRFAAEIEAIHKSVPLPLALSCEMPSPGDYKAITVAGTPVLISRDSSGQVHAMLNTCRHRGAELVPPGTGHARRFTCPYHSWSYGLDGCLRGVYGEKTTGPVDKGELSLRSLTVEERAGLIFVGLRPGMTFDLDDWLGDYAPILEGLRLEECTHWSMNTLQGPNWKVALDGYLEGYHFSTVHRDSLYLTTHSNIATFDSWGPHLRSCFALRSIEVEAAKPREVWDPGMAVGIAAVLFPGLAIAGGWRDQVAVSLVLPGATVDSSVTQQHILLRNKPSDDAEAKEANNTRDWFHDVVLDEDYAVNFGVQRGLASAEPDHEFIFMRNEPGVQHFHKIVDALVSGVSPLPAAGLAAHKSDREQPV